MALLGYNSMFSVVDDYIIFYHFSIFDYNFKMVSQYKGRSVSNVTSF